MKKNNMFLKSTFYLIIGGLITRTLGFIIRIVYTRIIGTEGIALYTIVMPTYSFLLTITSLALPISLSKLVAERKRRSISLLSNALVIVFIINILIIIIMLFSSKFIANHFLHEPAAKGLLIAMSFTFIFVSISSVIKGYFNGIQKTLPYMISNVLEQVLRLIIILLIIAILYKQSVYLAVKGLILLSIVSEIFSIIIFMFFIPKKVIIKPKDIKPRITVQKDILDVSIPTVSGRLIGNIGYFFEPIILMNLLILNGYNSTFILKEYGIYNTYSLSILTIPAFLITAISNSIIPEISKHMKKNNYRTVKRRVKECLIPTFILGIIFSLLIIIFRNQLLHILYKTNDGSNYILFLAPFFTLFYLENILYSILQASGNAKKAMYISTIGVVIKLLTLSILCFLKIGIYPLIISEVINILFVVITNIKVIKKQKLI